jgi:hypothetical protein
LSVGCAGFAVHQMGLAGIGHIIQSLAGIFTAELSALFTTLRLIAEVMRPPERFLILTDSLMSIKAMFSIKIATLRLLVDSPILLLYDTSALILASRGGEKDFMHCVKGFIWTLLRLVASW